MGKDLRGKEIGNGIFQRKDGFYVARITLISGGRKQKCFKTAKLAKDWISEIKYNEEHMSIYGGRNMNLDAWYKYWLENIKGDNVRFQTKRIYNYSYNKCISPYIGRMCLGDIKQLHCQNIINSEQKRGVGESTITHIIMVLTMLFQSAVENDLIEINPLKSRLQYKKDQKKERRVLSKYEQELFLKHAESRACYDLFCFALQTGMRFGELASLKWNDVDFGNMIIHIQRTVFYKKDVGYVFNPPKTSAGDRFIPLTEKAAAILKQLKKDRFSQVESMEYHEFIFLNRNGKILKDDDCNRILKRIAKEIGIEQFTMHTLRHTFATRAIEAGIKPKILQRILGHSNISMTLDLYVHATQDEIKKEMELFERFA